MTEFAANGFEGEIRTLGIVYYMTKPINEEELKGILDHSFQRGKEEWGRTQGKVL
jgi:AmiR/NasT family two-component response regulator